MTEYYDGGVNEPAKIEHVMANDDQMHVRLFSAFRDIVGVAFGAPAKDGKMENEGDLQSMTLPSGWQAEPRKTTGRGPDEVLGFYAPGDTETRIASFIRGDELSQASQDALSATLKAKPADKGPEALSPDEIRSLTEVFDRRNLGNNQHNNDGKTAVGPVFHITGANTVQIQGRTVVEVQGHYLDRQGNPVNQYHGILFQSSDRARVQQIYMVTNLDQYATRRREFRDTLNSIQWK